MLKSRRLTTVPIPDLAREFAVLDAQKDHGEYDSFTLGSWSSHVLANSSGSAGDTAFRPHSGTLQPTELGEQLPGIMALVDQHFHTERLQWIRVFALRDGILAPHVDFLEFDEPGTRLQVPLRTTTEALHSENDTVYHLRKGEVWQIHTTEPHSARSGAGPARLSLCLDFAGNDLALDDIVREATPPTQEIHLVDRPPLPDEELEKILDIGSELTVANMHGKFRAFAAAHFTHAIPAAGTFDLFSRAAARSSDPNVKVKADAFRVFCIEKRGYREIFSW